MPASGWMRVWRGERGEEEQPGALVRAAARGESIEHLLELGAYALLEVGGADRAGLWLASERPGEPGIGRVMDSSSAPTPEPWRHLDVYAPFLRGALESADPLRVELGPEESVPQVGPLVGMRSAIWIPLRVRGSTLGLAVVAYTQAHTTASLEALRVQADEISLAVSHYSESRKYGRWAEELRAQGRLARAILCGVAADSILPQIARAARQFAQAEFVVLARAETSPLLAEGWDGRSEWRTVLEQEPFMRAWRSVLAEGHEIKMGGDVLHVIPRNTLDGSLAVLSRLAAIPVEVRNQTAGLLVAGFTAPENTSEDLVRLESYALLAASALEQEAARKDRTHWTNCLRQMVEESSEWLLAIDEKGRIREASSVARAALRSDLKDAEDMPLEDLFASAGRDAVVQWRGKAAQGGAEAALVPLEAALAGGKIVRLRLRSALNRHGAAPPSSAGWCTSKMPGKAGRRRKRKIASKRNCAG